MIKRIEIHNYRSCLDTSFDVHPELSVLIGPNSSGKTNILSALLILKKLTLERQQFRLVEPEPTSQCKLKVWFDIEDKEAVLTIAANIFTDESNSDKIVSSVQEWYLRDFTGNRKRIKTPLWLIREFVRAEQGIGVYKHLSQRYDYMKEKVFSVPTSALRPLSQISEDLSEIRYHSATQLTDPSKCPVSFEVEKDGRSTRTFGESEHARFLINLYDIQHSIKTRYNEFFDIVGPNGIGLVDSIDFKEIQTSSIEYSVRSGGRVIRRQRRKNLVIPQFRIGKNALSPNQLSEGTFRTITLIFYLVTGTSRMLFIEEPEVCVHHGLLSSILELIKSYSRHKQIIISTHSDFVVDEVQPENVYKVSNVPEQGTKVSHITKSMSPSELKALHNYLETEGNLGEYWRHGGLDE